MERVKGIEPSYSAWKAAALPLSYTRVPPMNYHARAAVSTAMHGSVDDNRPCSAAPFVAGTQALNNGRIRAYNPVSTNNERR
jgi:hypothetical protein